MNQSKRELKKVLGPGFGLAVLIGGTIGVGILRSPGPIAALLQQEWLILLAWVCGGIYVLIAAASLAELATMLPKAGGAFNYVQRAFGNYAGFITGWFDYLLNAISPAYFSIAISEYTVLLFPQWQGHETFIALTILAAFTLLHLAGINSGSVAQRIMSIVKLLALILFIIFCFLKGHVYAMTDEAPGMNSVIKGGALVAFLRAMQLVIGTYDGWGVPVFFAEEDKDPGRNIPRSLFRGAIVVMLVYVLLNVALLQVFPVHAIAGSKLAAADVGNSIFGEAGATAITVIALLSLLSIMNAYMMVNPRILFGLSRAGFFINNASVVNKGGTPSVALIITSLLCTVLILIGSFEQLFALSAFMAMIIYALLSASVFKLRRSAPRLHRPYRAWGYPFTTLFMLLVSIGFFVGFAFSDPKNFVVVLVIAALAWVIFRWVVEKKIIGNSNESKL